MSYFAVSATYIDFHRNFCYTIADFAIYCAQFESMEIVNIVYMFSIRIRPVAANLAVIRLSLKKVW